jgi:hypothetical protein
MIKKDRKMYPGFTAKFVEDYSKGLSASTQNRAGQMMSAEEEQPAGNDLYNDDDNQEEHQQTIPTGRTPGTASPEKGGKTSEHDDQDEADDDEDEDNENDDESEEDDE